MSYFTKQPSEKELKGPSQARWLPSGVTISSATVSAVNAMTGENASATVLASTSATVTEEGTAVEVMCQGGEDGSTYNITFAMTLSTGEVWFEVIVMRVKAK